ncbi:MAG: DUF1307 domain-containing protein [Bacilli bacterium]|nr:DUF1307 domain-containing protein [Bacilli bacterium]
MKNKVLIALVILFLVCGCSSKEKVEISGEKINTNKMGHKHCVRNATAGSGVTADLEYEVYYTGDTLNLLQATEKVLSTSNETLDKYENAYRSIHEHYKGLDNYEAEVVRTETTVTSTVNINYDKIDIDELIAIEGAEDNIFDDKVPKLSKWLELAKKVGATCEEVE